MVGDVGWGPEKTVGPTEGPSEEVEKSISWVGGAG